MEPTERDLEYQVKDGTTLKMEDVEKINLAQSIVQ
jgi:hypothetical protein